MSKIIIQPYASGLGDQLLFSTLPRLYSIQGHDVYISNSPGCRNEEVKNLVWKDNPCVKGFTDEPGNIIGGKIFDRKKLPENQIFFYKNYSSPINVVEKIHGFGNLSQPVYPYISYIPKFLSRRENTIIFDPYSQSQGFTKEVLEEFVNWVCKWNNYYLNDVTILQSKYSGTNGSEVFPDNKRYYVENIYEYCDIINSCKAFLVTESGGQSLASALKAKNPNIEAFALHTTESFNNKYFIYPNITTFVTSKMTVDFSKQWN